jgi:hypothetical protein
LHDNAAAPPPKTNSSNHVTPTKPMSASSLQTEIAAGQVEDQVRCRDRTSVTKKPIDRLIDAVCLPDFSAQSQFMNCCNPLYWQFRAYFICNIRWGLHHQQRYAAQLIQSGLFLASVTLFHLGKLAQFWIANPLNDSSLVDLILWTKWSVYSIIHHHALDRY